METKDSESVSPSGESDRELIRRAQGGDQQAFADLYGRYRRKVLNYLYRFTGNRSVSEDLTQETFLKISRNLDRYQPTGSVAGWIYKIAGNLALNALRDRPASREISLDEPLELEEGTVSRMETLAGSDPRPDEEAVRAEQERVVQQALMKISPPYRKALILCDIEGYPYRIAAQILDCSINTIASRVARGRIQLADLLGYLRGEKP